MFTITPAHPADAAIARTVLNLAPIINLDVPTRLGLVDSWEQACADLSTLTPARCGTLAATLADRHLRDAVLMLSIGADPDLIREIATGTAPRDASAPVTAAMLSAETGVEPGERAQQIVDVCAVIVGHLAHGPSYGLLAMMSWWQDDRRVAGAAAIVANSLDPTFVPTYLILETMREGLTPGWRARLNATFEDIVSTLDEER